MAAEPKPARAPGVGTSAIPSRVAVSKNGCCWETVVAAVVVVMVIVGRGVAVGVVVGVCALPGIAPATLRSPVRTTPMTTVRRILGLLMATSLEPQNVAAAGSQYPYPTAGLRTLQPTI